MFCKNKAKSIFSLFMLALIICGGISIPISENQRDFLRSLSAGPSDSLHMASVAHSNETWWNSDSSGNMFYFFKRAIVNFNYYEAIVSQRSTSRVSNLQIHWLLFLFLFLDVISFTLLFHKGDYITTFQNGCSSIIALFLGGNSPPSRLV